MNAALASVMGTGDFALLDGATMISVTLSERNLRDLLAQWEERGHAVLTRRTEDDYLLTIRIETDDIHYAGREAGPGSGLVPRGDEENPFPPQATNEP